MSEEKKPVIRSRYRIEQVNTDLIGYLPKFDVYRDGVLIARDDTHSDAEASVRADIDERDEKL